MSRSEKVNLYETIAISRNRASLHGKEKEVKIPLLSFNDPETDQTTKSPQFSNQEQLLAEFEKIKKENAILKGLIVEKDEQLQEYCNKAKQYEAQVKELEPLKTENVKLKDFITKEIGKVNAQLAVTEGKLLKIALERERASQTPKKRAEMGHIEARSPNNRATPKSKDDKAGKVKENQGSKAKTVQAVLLGERFISTTPKQKRALMSSNGFSSPSNRTSHGYSSPLNKTNVFFGTPSHKTNNTPPNKLNKSNVKSVTPMSNASKGNNSKSIIKTPNQHRRNLTEKTGDDTFTQRVSFCLQEEDTSPRGGVSSQLTSSIRLETDSTGESINLDFHQQFMNLMEEINKKVLNIWAENETLDSVLLDKNNQIENLTNQFSKVENKLEAIKHEKVSLTQLLKEKVKEVTTLKTELQEAHLTKEEFQERVKEKGYKDTILAQKLKEAEAKMIGLKIVEGELRRMVQTAQGALFSSESDKLIRTLNGFRSKSTGKLNTVLNLMSPKDTFVANEKPLQSPMKNEVIKGQEQIENNKSEYFISKGVPDFSKSQSSFCSEVSTTQSNPVCFSNVGLEYP